MRLLSLEIAGFRGFATKREFDLDADAVVVVGANGNGKTSLFDAVLWAISGRVPRLGTEDERLVCKFSEAGQARVSLRLAEEAGLAAFKVTRIFDGTRTTVSLETPDGVVRGPEAEGQLIQRIWKEAATAADPQESLATALTRSVYLQQDLVREFIDSVTAQERFGALSELVGAGRVTDLQAELERAKKAWSLATNIRVAETEPLRDRLATMESRLAELTTRQTSANATLQEAAWSEWWLQLRDAGVEVSSVPIASRDATSAINNAIVQADAARRAAERRRVQLEMLAQEINRVVQTPLPDLEALRSKLSESQLRVQEARERVLAEQARVAEVRRLQAELEEASQQLQTLASLALKHLGAHCPVCDQEYDVNATRRRLELAAVGGANLDSSVPLPEMLPALLEELAAQELGLTAAEVDLRAAEQFTRESVSAESIIDKRLVELGVGGASPPDRLAAVATAAQATSLRIDKLATAQRVGEEFALLLSQAGDQAATVELQREVESAKATLQSENAELDTRVAIGEEAQEIIEALREAASRVVTERVKEIEPLLNDIYSRIDLHPAFRAVRFLASVTRGRGQLATVVSDPRSEIQSDAPATVLSSSQLNALAVCTFLSLNLGVSRPPLDVTILDDPLQSLDDINLLGLIDLLRRTKDQRQLIVSTHDARFGELLARKLRPGSAEQRTVVIELDGWNRTGPTVSSRDVHCDPVPLRLVTAGAGSP